MWFISENDLLLARTDPKLNPKQGLFTVIYNLQELNNAIWRFNNEELNAGNRLTNFLDFYNVWKAENDGDIHSYLDRLISGWNIPLIVNSLSLLGNLTAKPSMGPPMVQNLHACVCMHQKRHVKESLDRIITDILIKEPLLCSMPSAME